jgi:hypothetical protein
LPDNAIVEMDTNVNEDISQDNIVKRYNALKCALPEKWTQTIQTIATFLYTLLEYNTNIYSLMTYIQFLLAISYSIYYE